MPLAANLLQSRPLLAPIVINFDVPQHNLSYSAENKYSSLIMNTKFKHKLVVNKREDVTCSNRAPQSRPTLSLVFIRINMILLSCFLLFKNRIILCVHLRVWFSWYFDIQHDIQATSNWHQFDSYSNRKLCVESSIWDNSIFWIFASLIV